MAGGYIAAVYFPPTQATFTDVKNKFAHDLAGVKVNSASGIAFFTNQRLAPAERRQLEDSAKAISTKAIIYHLEAIEAFWTALGVMGCDCNTSGFP